MNVSVRLWYELWAPLPATMWIPQENSIGSNPVYVRTLLTLSVLGSLLAFRFPHKVYVFYCRIWTLVLNEYVNLIFFYLFANLCYIVTTWSCQSPYVLLHAKRKRHWIAIFILWMLLRKIDRVCSAKFFPAKQFYCKIIWLLNLTIWGSVMKPLFFLQSLGWVKHALRIALQIEVYITYLFIPLLVTFFFCIICIPYLRKGLLYTEFVRTQKKSYLDYFRSWEGLCLRMDILCASLLAVEEQLCGACLYLIVA